MFSSTCTVSLFSKLPFLFILVFVMHVRGIHSVWEMWIVCSYLKWGELGAAGVVVVAEELSGKSEPVRALWPDDPLCVPVGMFGWKMPTSVQFSHSVMSDSLQPHGLQHARLLCPSAIPVFPQKTERFWESKFPRQDSSKLMPRGYNSGCRHCGSTTGKEPWVFIYSLSPSIFATAPSPQLCLVSSNLQISVLVSLQWGRGTDRALKKQEEIWESCCSVAQLCLTLHDSVDCSSPGVPCPSPSPRACLNSCSLNRWCHPTISSFVVPFSFCPQSFPASGSFQMSQFFTSCDQSIGASASASVLPVFRVDFF